MAAGALLSASQVLRAEESDGSALTRGQNADLFSEAKDLFRKGNDAWSSDRQVARDFYHKSALRFERIAREGGIRNGQLFYNIGNAYFRMNDLGRAILNYRRAALYTPNDTNLQQNLDFARKTRKDVIDESSEARALQVVFFWHYDFSTRVRAWTFGITFVVAWILAASLLFRPRSLLKWAVGACALMSLLCLTSLIIESATTAREQPGVILADSLVARKGDSESYEASFQNPLHAGTEFQVVEARGPWLHVALLDGRECWLPRSGVALVKEDL